MGEQSRHARARRASRAARSITIDNEVLDDPTLIDPGTGLPFGGVLALGLSTFTDIHTLQPGETDFKAMQMSRSCIAGIVSKRALVDNYGLTETPGDAVLQEADDHHLRRARHVRAVFVR